MNGVELLESRASFFGRNAPISWDVKCRVFNYSQLELQFITVEKMKYLRKSSGAMRQRRCQIAATSRARSATNIEIVY